jgi:hypothetical protein
MLNDGNVSPDEAEQLYMEADGLCESILKKAAPGSKVEKVVRALNSAIFDAFDRVAGEMDDEFNAENDAYNDEKMGDDFQSDEDEFDYDEDAAAEEHFKSLSTESLNRVINKMIKEEMTKLNVFGKHPGYRKKPMTLPTTGEDKNQWGEDWNDESVYSEQPFGEKIGNSAPFDKVVSKLSEMVFNDIKKKL